MIPRGVDLEITEQRPPTQPLSGDTGNTVVVPNHCRINGQPVLMPSGVPVEIEACDDDVVTARLTVMVHRLRIHPEHTEPEDNTDPPIYEGVRYLYNLDPDAIAIGIRAYISIAAMALTTERLTR